VPPVWQPFEYEHIHLFCRNVIVLATDRLLSLARTSPLSQATPPLVSSPTVERSVDVQMAMVPDLLADDDLPPPIPWIHVRHWRRNPRLSLEPISPRLIWSTNNTAVDHKADQPSHWALDQVIGPVGPFVPLPERVEPFVSLPERLLKSIEGLLWKTYLIFFTFLNITFRLFHAFLLLQLTMQKHYFDIHLLQL